MFTARIPLGPAGRLHSCSRAGSGSAVLSRGTRSARYELQDKTSFEQSLQLLGCVRGSLLLVA